MKKVCKNHKRPLACQEGVLVTFPCKKCGALFLCSAKEIPKGFISLIDTGTLEIYEQK